MEDFLPGIKTAKCIPGCQEASCSRYHSLFDYRRSTITYSPVICLEAVKSGFCTHSSCLHCINYIEYLYHPQVYKTRECISSKLGLICFQGAICPHSHKDHPEEKGPSFPKKPEKPEKIQEKIKEPAKQANEVQLPEQSENKTPLLQEERKESPAVFIPPNPVQPEDHPKSILQNEARLKFIINQEVQFFEDRYNEFKECRGRSFDVTYACNLLSSYVSAFLNTEGGTIFYGISDSGFVSGVRMMRRTRDLFTQSFDGILNKFRPAIGPDLYSVLFNQVHGKDGLVMNELYVIEVRVKQGDKKKIYYTHKEEAYIKRDSSVNILKGPALVEFARGKES
jgi:hypothetical protein